MTKSNNEWVPGQKVKLVDHLDYEDILLYGHECVGEELEIKAIFMDGSTEVCAVNLNGINYCFASRILEPIKTEAEKRREVNISQMYFDATGEVLQGNEMDDIDALGLCETLVNAGWIKPKPLTDDVIEKLYKVHLERLETHLSVLDHEAFAKSIETYIHGEDL